MGRSGSGMMEKATPELIVRRGIASSSSRARLEQVGLTLVIPVRRLPRHRFTVRFLLVLVAAVAILLGLAAIRRRGARCLGLAYVN